MLSQFVTETLGRCDTVVTAHAAHERRRAGLNHGWLAVLALSVLIALLQTASAFASQERRVHVQLFNNNPTEPQNTSNIKQLRASAEQGDPNEYMLGLAYDVGVGAPQDFAEAALWYRKAADQGHAGAQYSLGHLYANGRGVRQDFVQAHMWLNLATAGSQPGARTERDLVAKKMTRSQLAEAARLAREWQPQAEVHTPKAAPTAPSEDLSSPEDRNRPP
jgi:TPR repeat protein